MAKVFTITEGLENLGALKSGGQGSVYKARRSDGTITAVKLLPTPVSSESAGDKNFVAFRNEVQKLRRVNEKPNEHIVDILSSGITDTGSLPYIEMEYIDGPDLEELLKPPYESIFTIEEAIKLALQMADALAHCQKMGVVHGDIKTNNIKLNRKTGKFVLLDFGLALMSDEQRRSSMRHAGAIEFMAPEQGKGQLVYGTDVYSFGVVLYEVLAGQVPFPLQGTSETARNAVMLAHMESPPPDLLNARRKNMPANWSDHKRTGEVAVPSWLLYMVDKCLAKDPDDRFVNAVALKEYIEEERREAAFSAGDRPRSRQRTTADKEIPVSSLVPDEARAKAVARKRKQVRRQSAKRKKMSPLLLLVLFLGGSLLVYGAYKLFINPAPTAKVPSETASVPEVETSSPKSTPVEESVDEVQREPLQKKEEREVEQARREPSVDLPSEPVVKDEPAKPKPQQSITKPPEKKVEVPDEGTNTTAKYKVRSKAYFHNEPDESTRRAAFIVHWNNAVLEPTQEKNDFVYIVFTNHQGQTSRGWLRIKDLVKVGE
jgi:serine/threonine-protein kinase